MPRISQEQKRLNREKIISAAGEGFRTRGIDGIGIDELMKSAGMTHGGFYNHFSSKEDLALEVLHQGFTDSLGELARIRAAHPRSAKAALQDLIDEYLSAQHRDHPEASCPSSALVTDAGRHGVAAQAEYHLGLDGYFTAITELLLERAHQAGAELDPSEAREQAIALFSQMVGALVMARATVQAAPGLSDEVLTANQRQLSQR
ncbi:MAG TPA: TetR/AcrR family transcriptional regulator [Pseudonocardia sp.]|nr:TetR/AcrR family transcriptional regulator [Pseudonocardia sp.]